MGNLIGETTIELFDGKTGELVEVHKDKNMITNYYADLLKPIFKNPGGVTIYNSEMKDGGHNVKAFTQGVLCFANKIDEDSDNYLVKSDWNMTAHAGDVTYSGSDLTMGSYNNEISEIDERQLKYVWDFTLEQGNGVISSVCLCPPLTGTAGVGSPYFDNDQATSHSMTDWFKFPSNPYLMNIELMHRPNIKSIRYTDYIEGAKLSGGISLDFNKNVYSHFSIKLYPTMYLHNIDLHDEAHNIFDAKMGDAKLSDASDYIWYDDRCRDVIEINLHELFNTTFNLSWTLQDWTYINTYASHNDAIRFSVCKSRQGLWVIAHKKFKLPDGVSTSWSNSKFMPSNITDNVVYGVCLDPTTGETVDTFEFTNTSDLNYVVSDDTESNPYGMLNRSYIIVGDYLYTYCREELGNYQPPEYWCVVNIRTGDCKYLKDMYSDKLLHNNWGFMEITDDIITLSAKLISPNADNNPRFALWVINVAKSYNTVLYTKVNTDELSNIGSLQGHTDNVIPTIGNDLFYFMNAIYSNIGTYQYVIRLTCAIKPFCVFSINNLSTPVTKTVDKTMRITYIIKDATKEI